MQHVEAVAAEGGLRGRSYGDDGDEEEAEEELERPSPSSIACCIQSTCNRKNKRHSIDKHEVLCAVLEAIKKSPLTSDERATVLVLARFCLDNGLVRGVPLWRLVLQNVAVFAKKNVL
ncbi:hypothetical protein B484DRAFT_406153 [Ochromonadaceae sp. CCMP2298]|nr:hypothetical protein B484DRAFT_406153 [Ochromonadaceae sp. CCMP2298]